MHAQWVLFIFLSKSYIVAPSWCLWWTYFPMCFLVFTKICLIIWSLNKYPPCWSFKLSKSNQFKVDIKSKTGLMWNADMWLTNLPFKNSMHNTESFQMWNQIAKFNSRKLITTRWIDCCINTILMQSQHTFLQFSSTSEWDLIIQLATLRVMDHSNF